MKQNLLFVWFIIKYRMGRLLCILNLHKMRHVGYQPIPGMVLQREPVFYCQRSSCSRRRAGWDWATDYLLDPEVR